MKKNLSAKPLVIRDEIHGDMGFDPLVREVIDHEYFQRLRHIKQLGLAEFVFPCANHTRFQHSLGAAYLAGEYFQSMVQNWLTAPFTFEGSIGKTRFYAEKTRACFEEVVGDPASKTFWHQVVSLAGLLHDVGHGPWSHTFEHLDLKQEFESALGDIPGALGAYLRKNLEAGRRLRHEDVSVLYIFHILKSLADRGILSSLEQYLLPVAMLANRKMTSSSFHSVLQSELENSLNRFSVKGGADFHRLLRPLISGPFDVDRIDYIQRDGQNCGVHIAGIEWRRIVSKVLPCLADHEGNENEPSDVVLISNIKNQHVIDDFIFTLFQMYAQVYLHPKIVGLEEIIKELLQSRLDSPYLVVDFEVHRSLTDERFRDLLKREFKIPEIDKMLARVPGYQFEVERYPSDPAMEDELRKNHFRLVESHDRPMMKDGVGVFLYSSYKEGDCEHYFVKPWSQVSPLAEQSASLHYSPNIWVRPDPLIEQKL
jgi:uncharacterized protein